MIGDFFILARRFKRGIAEIFVDDNDLILDLGCGFNPRYHRLIKGKLICFDIQKTLGTDVVGDADKLPFKQGSFDKVVSVNSLNYFNNPQKVINDLGELLKKDGKLVLVVPFFYPVHNPPGDKFRFTEYGLKRLLETKFKIDILKPIGGFFSSPSVLVRSLIKGLPLLFSRRLRWMAQLITFVVYPFYLLSQLFSILDVFDKTRRFPVYYFLVASRK